MNSLHLSRIRGFFGKGLGVGWGEIPGLSFEFVNMTTVKELTVSERIYLWLAKSAENTKMGLAQELGIARPTLDKLLKDNKWELKYKVILDRLI